MTNNLCDATCGNALYVRRNAALTLHVTGDMKRRESNETLSPKHGTALNTRNDFIRRYIERVTSISGKIASGVAVRVDSGVAGGELLVYQSFIHEVSGLCHYRISTQIGCPSLPLACVLCGSFKLHLGV